jgi:hypothetical protein
VNTDQCNLLQTRISWLLRGFQECFAQPFPQNLLKTDSAGRLGRPLCGSFGLKRPTPEQQGFSREKGYLPLDFRYTGPEEERPQFHLVRGRRCGEII